MIEEYRKLIPEYVELARKANRDDQPLEVPQPIKSRLNLLASMLEKTVEEMEHMTQETGNTPKMMLRQATNSAHKRGNQ